MKLKIAPLVSVLFLLLNFHLLRNVSTVGYLALLMVFYVPLLLLALPKLAETLQFRSITAWLVAYLLTALAASLTTFIDYNFAAGAYAFSRYFLTVPFAFVAYAFISTDKEIDKVLRLYVVFVAIAVFMIPLQYLTGPISWFAEPSERANMVRYSSMLGSLTSAGAAVPFAIFMALFLDFKPTTRILVITTLIASSIMSLQKAAIMGVVIAVSLYLVLSGKRGIGRLILLGLSLLLVSSIANYLLADWSVWKQSTTYVLASLRLDESAELGGDVTIVQSIIDRFTYLPASSLSDLFSTRGDIGIITGGGFGMVGAALMRPGDSPYITAHNGYVDFVLVGGIFHLVAFVGLALAILWESWRTFRHNYRSKMRTTIPVIFLGTFVIGLIQLLFASGFTFHPNSSTVLWLIVGFMWHRQNLRTKYSAVKLPLTRIQQA